MACAYVRLVIVSTNWRIFDVIAVAVGIASNVAPENVNERDSRLGQETVEGTYGNGELLTNDVSLSTQPKNAYEIIPITDKAPTKTFQTAKYRAFGLYLDITIPELSTPIAEKAKATVPVTRLR